MMILRTLLVLILISLAGNLSAATYTVNPEGTADFTTIQAAVDVADDGDTILIGAGVYNENVFFPEPAPGLHLLGNRAGTIIDAGGIANCLRVVHEEGGCSGTLSNLIFRNAGSGVTQGYTDFGVIINIDGGDWTIRDCEFRDHPSGGLVGSSVLDMDLCLFENCGGGGGFVNSMLGIASVYQCTFASCTNGYVSAYNTISGDVQNCIFVDCNYSIMNHENADLLNDCNLHWEIGGDFCLGCTVGDQDQFADPQFCDVDGSGNYYLQSDSPATGDAQCGDFGAFGVGCENTSTEDCSWSAIKSLY